MKITFVQNDEEMAVVNRVIRAGLSLRKPRLGTWVVPPSLSKAPGMFTVVDSQDGKNVFVESFGSIDGALFYALGISSAGPTRDCRDVPGTLKDWGNFV